MTGWEFFADVFSGKYPATNWLLILAGVLIIIFVTRRILWAGFKQEFKRDLNVATKDDLEVTKKELKIDVEAVRTDLEAAKKDLKTDLEMVKKDLKTDLEMANKDLKTDLEMANKDLKTDLEAVKTDIRIIADGLDEIKDILKNQTVKSDDTINRLSKLEGIVQELSKRIH
jgi:outer membrane murein-binding lipoprotein Lpp